MEVPAIFIDLDPIGRRAGYVMSGNVAAMASVVSHLHDTGRDRIAYICGLQNTRPGPDRLFGYRSEIDRLGLPAPDEYVEQGDYYHHSSYEATKRLLALPERPDAITCASDIMAIGAMMAITETGLRIPEDVAVTGFDDAPFAAGIKPSLTTVARTPPAWRRLPPRGSCACSRVQMNRPRHRRLRRVCHPRVGGPAAAKS